jgi:Rps23 Pro-64 3,4-dihydroxylase Tpa1-like proline 4-hydroxylase
MAKATTTEPSPGSAVPARTRWPVGFEGARYEPSPFPHFYARRAIEPEFAERLLRWFETGAPWKAYLEKDFYETYALDLRKVPLPEALSVLLDPELGARLASQVGSMFGSSLDGFIDVEAHKQVPGHVIRVHNDTGMEVSHRVVVQLTRAWKPEDGGVLLFLHDNACERFGPEDRVYPPVEGSAAGFVISESSHHAVTEIKGGERYTLVFSFRAPGVAPQ